MFGLLVINDKDQDPGLAVAFYAAMEDREWKTNEEMPLVFTREFATGNAKQIREAIEKDIEQAVFDAEWSRLKYVFTISTENPVYGQSS